MTKLPGRGTFVVVFLALAVAILVVATRPWLVVDLSGMLAGSPSAPVTGSQASPVVPALALVALAASGLLTIAGRIASAAAMIGIAASGGIAAVAAVAVMRDPVSAAAAVVSDQTGGVEPQLDQISVMAWPLVCIILGAVLALAGLVGLVAGSSWQGRRRFEADRTAAVAEREPEGPAETWDALSQGEDPTSPGTMRSDAHEGDHL